MKTKKSILLAAMLGIAGLMMTPGCMTNGQPDYARIARVSKEAATTGTTEVLASHPEWRPQFQLAADDLHQLATASSISVDDILNIAQRLPVKELKSQTARLSFASAKLMIASIDVPELSADQLANLQPIAQAIADGINNGMPAIGGPIPVPLPKPKMVGTPVPGN